MGEDGEKSSCPRCHGKVSFVKICVVDIQDRIRDIVGRIYFSPKELCPVDLVNC